MSELPENRVAEFLRQWKLGKTNSDLIHSVNTDPKAKMADLTVSDLERLVKLAESI